MNTYLALDLGGTKLMIAEVSEKGEILRSKQYKSGYRIVYFYDGYHEVLKKISAHAERYLKERLENYLNNPNNEIRVMAAKEILTRLDEDKSRYKVPQ